MTPEQKKLIDGMSLKEMLALWRHTPAGNPLFQGDTGLYFQRVMNEKRDDAPRGEWTRISKEVGW